MPAEAAPVAPAVTPPSPSPAPAPAAPAAAPSTEVIAAPSTVLDSFDKQFEIEETPATPPAPAATKPPGTATKPPEGATPTPPTATKPPAPATEEGFESPQAGTIMEVRNWGKRMGAMAKTATAKVKELEAKLAEMETKAPELPPDVAKLQEDYGRLQQEVQQHRERLARADYSQSPEYEEKYQKPYQQAYLRGRQTVENLRVTEPGENGQPTTRPGTAEDFDRLYSMSDADADQAAEVMFGPSARRVIAMRDAAKEKGEAAYNAIKENTTKYAEEKKRAAAMNSQQRMALSGLFRKVHEDLLKKHGKYFDKRDGDNEWNEALAKGRQVAMQRFTAQYNELSPEQRVVLDAQIYNRAAAFLPMRALMTRLETQLAEANKTIEQLRGSGPGRPTPTTTEKTGETNDWEKDFDARVS